jgi:purine-nucleoside/S-methyl-5'-thioadenosine phosphorylase / adenosine deaminase
MGWRVERWRAIEGLEHCFGGRGDDPAAPVTTLRQVHGSTVLPAGAALPGTDGDGLCTAEPGTLVGVRTADCVPLHLVAPRRRVAAAIHCGWRGSAAGIVPRAVETVAARYGAAAGELEAALGPSIGGCCYEVGEEVRSAFVERAGDAAAAVGFSRRGDRLFLDLRDFLAAELATLGVRTVERVGPCTACHPDLLYSFRRERGAGRQLSWIGWSG